MKPYYQDAFATIYHGDARALVDSVSGDVLITDPPYGFGSYETDSALPAEFFRLMVGRSKTAAIFGYPELLVSMCAQANLVPEEWITWWCYNSSQGRAKYLCRESEHIAVFGSIPGSERLHRKRSETSEQIINSPKREKWRKEEQHRREGDVWRFAAPGVGFNSHMRLHPNEKPIEIMARLVLLCSEPEQVILDTSAGSGTTLRAAKDLGRKSIGIEIEERFCEVAAKRLSQEVLPFAG